MKNLHQERLRQRAKIYHRSHAFGVDESGLYTRHVFENERHLSWWQDLGFILNDRRVMVWWTHPRQQYCDAIKDEVWKAAGEMPGDIDDLFAADPNYKRVGRSRKKIVTYTSRPTPKATAEFYDRVSALREQLEATGIEQIITPSIEIGHYGWCTGVDLCVPMEVCTHADGVALIALARRLLTRQTTCAIEFPAFKYGQTEWLSEAKDREADTVRRRIEFSD